MATYYIPDDFPATRAGYIAGIAWCANGDTLVIKDNVTINVDNPTPYELPPFTNITIIHGKNTSLVADAVTTGDILYAKLPTNRIRIEGKANARILLPWRNSTAVTVADPTGLLRVGNTDYYVYSPGIPDGGIYGIVEIESLNFEGARAHAVTTALTSRTTYKGNTFRNCVNTVKAGSVGPSGIIEFINNVHYKDNGLIIPGVAETVGFRTSHIGTNGFLPLRHRNGLVRYIGNKVYGVQNHYPGAVADAIYLEARDNIFIDCTNGFVFNPGVNSAVDYFYIDGYYYHGSTTAPSDPNIVPNNLMTNSGLELGGTATHFISGYMDNVSIQRAGYSIPVPFAGALQINGNTNNIEILNHLIEDCNSPEAINVQGINNNFHIAGNRSLHRQVPIGVAFSGFTTGSVDRLIFQEMNYGFYSSSDASGVIRKNIEYGTVPNSLIIPPLGMLGPDVTVSGP